MYIIYTYFTPLSTNYNLELKCFREMCQMMRQEDVGCSTTLSAGRQTGSSFISELTRVCNGSNLRVETVLQVENLGWL